VIEKMLRAIQVNESKKYRAMEKTPLERVRL
jgi:hypothetical protein